MSYEQIGRAGNAVFLQVWHPLFSNVQKKKHVEKYVVGPV